MFVLDLPGRYGFDMRPAYPRPQLRRTISPELVIDTDTTLSLAFAITSVQQHSHDSDITLIQWLGLFGPFPKIQKCRISQLNLPMWSPCGPDDPKSLWYSPDGGEDVQW